MIRDLVHAARTLGRSPGFTTICVLTLGLGIGASTAVFSGVNATLLRPPPFPDADRLVFVWGERAGSGAPQLPVSLTVALEIEGRSRTIDAMGAWTALPDMRFNLTGDGLPENVQYGVVSAGLLPLLGVEAAAGRLPGPADDEMAAGRVALISDDLWQRRFGGRADAVGGSLTLDGVAYTVIGVLPPSFRFVDFPRRPDVWLPLGADPFVDRRYAFGAAAMGVVARLSPDATIEAARGDLARVAVEIGEVFPLLREWTLEVVPLHEQLASGRRDALLALFGAVCALLLVATGNVAGLRMIRAADREHELGLRTALGATQGRLLRQVAAESLVLAGAGALVGVVVASLGRGVVVTLASGQGSIFVPHRTTAEDLGASGAVVAFVFAAALLSALATGVAPALRALARPVGDGLFHGTRVSGRDRGRSVLLAGQVAVTLALVAGSALLLRSFASLAASPTGFDATRVLALDLQLSADGYPDGARISAFYDAYLERVTGLPGVEAAAAVEHLPLTGPMQSTDLRIAGRPDPMPGEEPRSQYASVTAGYFGTMGIEVRQGRSIEVGDAAASLPVVVVNEAFALAHFPGEDPLGRRIALSVEALRFLEPNRPPVLDFPSAYREIVGVVADVRQTALAETPLPTAYVPASQRAARDMTVVARISGEENALAAEMRRLLADVDPSQPVTSLRPLRAVVAESVGEPRFRAQLLGAFAATALFLAALGIYGVVAYFVSRRRKEIGISMALGADAWRVARATAWRGIRPATLGVAAGVPLAMAAGVGLRGMLYGTEPLDAAALAAAVAILLVTAVLAAAVPAVRATRVEPAVALRADG